VVSERKLVWDILRNWNQQTRLFLFQTDFDTDDENSKEQICPTKEIEWGRPKFWPLSNWDDSWDPPLSGLLFIDPILCINKQRSLWRMRWRKKKYLDLQVGWWQCCLQFVPSPRCPWAVDNKCSKMRVCVCVCSSWQLGLKEKRQGGILDYLRLGLK
jgi:hypothetical protein